MSRSAMFCTIIAATSLLVSTAPITAGDLNPPPGPIAPTHKTLTQVEPRTPISAATTPGDADSLYKITQPGSYYLTGNITGELGKHGVEIAVGSVSIDLMGFEMRGVAGSLDGISNIGSDNGNISVRNGTVCGWGLDGLDLTATGGEGCIVSDIHACGNGVVGIIGTFQSVITRCVTSDNGSHGIDCRSHAVVESCTAYQNGADGIGVDSIATITGCTSYSNVSSGFSAGDAAVISACSAYNNGFRGFNVNTTCTLTVCVAQINSGEGFFSNDGTTISNCAARFNEMDGIEVTDDCVVLDNACSNNGSGGTTGAGIRAIGFGNRIEGNQCSGADIGIDVDGTQNFIARNTCRGNTTNWSVVAGNACLVVLVTPNAAINGDAGGTSPGSTNPNANFTH